MSDRPRVIYVSYDGATEPLGRSQVVAYLERLSSEFDIRLISFEKREPTGEERTELRDAGIRWLPQRYHRRPPVLSSAYDIVRGARVLGRELARLPAAVIHTRSYVATDMVLRCRAAARSRLVFDIRGFWVDERVEGGLWRPGTPLERYARGRERLFYSRADAVVTLTEASRPVIERWLGARRVPVEVIPTCADLERFGGSRARDAGPSLAWVGSIGTWYRFDLALRASESSGMRLRVFTGQPDEARRQAGDRAEVGWVPPDRLPEVLHAGDVGLCLYKHGFSRLACAPTRFAEYLAAGMPVVATPGIGDLEQIVEEQGVGVVLRDESRDALREAVATAVDLGRGESTRSRCREVAAARFSVDDGARAYARLYRDLAGEAGRRVARGARSPSSAVQP